MNFRRRTGKEMTVNLVLFHRYGTDYFLSDVVNPGNFAAKMSKSKEEVNLGREFGIPAREPVALNPIKY